MDIIGKFNDGDWKDKASAYIGNTRKTGKLLSKVNRMLSKTGFKPMIDDIRLICSYVSDVVSGKYKDYSTANLVLAIAGLIYLVTPVDIIPDFLIPFGFTDDVAVLAWILKTAKGELDRYRDIMSSERQQSRQTPDSSE
ncbi:MAG: YkvA family protein [Candidatus Aphodosoma sp.]